MNNQFILSLTNTLFYEALHWNANKHDLRPKLFFITCFPSALNSDEKASGRRKGDKRGKGERELHHETVSGNKGGGNMRKQS